MKAGILLLLGAAVIVLYLTFNTNQSGGPLGNQPSILQRIFPGQFGASGVNPSPLTNRGLTPSNYVLPATSQTPVGVATAFGAGVGALTGVLTSIFRGNPANTPTPAQQASGNGVADGGTLSSQNGGLLQGPNPSGTPLSVSAGWQPTDSVIGNTGLTAPSQINPQSSTLDLSALNTIDTVANTDPLTGNVIYTPSTSDISGASVYPGYDSTVPVDTGVVSLPDATTPDLVLA